MFSNQLCLIKFTPRYLKNVLKAISKLLPWFLELAEGNSQLSNKCQYLKKAKENITPCLCRLVALWGQDPWGLPLSPSRKGSIPPSQVEAGKTGGTGAAPALGTWHAPGDRSRPKLGRDVGMQAGLNQQSPCASRAELWELDMCCPRVPVGQRLGGWDKVLSPGKDERVSGLGRAKQGWSSLKVLTHETASSRRPQIAFCKPLS